MPRKHALVNGSVYLGYGRVIERGYVVFSGGLIEDCGAATDFIPTSGTEITDLAGKLVLPGLVDAHLHLASYGRSLIEPDLAATSSLDQGLQVVRAFAAGLKPGEWLTGRGWDKQRWAMAEFPTRAMLDRAVGDRPVSLTSRDGHVAWLNTAALRELGLHERVEAVEGGEVVTDSDGRPTGIFKENAAVVVWARLGGRNRERTIEAIATGSRKLRSLGLVGAHTLEDRLGSEVMAEALARGKIAIKLFRLREVHEPGEIADLEPAPGATCIKTYADGTLGSQTASMLAPYCGQPANLGIPALTPGKLHEIVFRALGKGFGVAVHAIGDRATREVLAAYEDARSCSDERPAADRSAQPKVHPAVQPSPRPAGGAALLRVEHAQIVDPLDIPRFAQHRIVASMQPIHLVSDRHVADKYWGPRSATAYAWKRIMDTGGAVAFGSDAPIESPDPLRGMHAAVARCSPSAPEEGPWYPDERIQAWQAVDCYTVGSAAAAYGVAGMCDAVGGLTDSAGWRGGPSDRLGDGKIRPGAPADLTLLDRDILGSSDPQALLDAAVVGTVVGGDLEFNP